jgi:hypothetical protein
MPERAEPCRDLALGEMTRVSCAGKKKKKKKKEKKKERKITLSGRRLAG